MSVEWPDTEGACRAYLRQHADVTAVVGTRVFFAVPRQPTFPLVTLGEQGSFDDPSDAPIALDLQRFDCWGGLHDDGHASPNKAEARAVRDAVRQALYDLNHRSVDVDLPATAERAAQTVRLDGAQVQSSSYLPDPGDGRPRYVVVALITARKLITIP